MLVSEQQAVGKWCPFARSAEFMLNAGNIQTIVSGFNRNEGGSIPSCIGSACMAWRFAEPKQLKDIDLVTSDVMELPPRLGYCGHFGAARVWRLIYE